MWMLIDIPPAAKAALTSSSTPTTTSVTGSDSLCTNYHQYLQGKFVIRTEFRERRRSPLRHALGNFGFLLRGRGIAAVMLLGATALMARGLGVVEFGLVVLMQTYVLLVRGLLNVKQFQAIIRYGVPAHDANDTRALRRLISICRRVDFRTSIAATTLAVVMAPLLGPAMGLDSDQVVLLTIYSLVLLTSANITDIGILRLFDRFDILGKKEAIGPIIRFLGVALAWWVDAALPAYVVVLAIAYVAENIYLSWSGRREYRARIGPAPEGEGTGDATMDEFFELRNFLWVTYWQSNIDLIPKHISVLLAGWLLGPAEAGLLRLARQFSSLLSKPAVLIRQVVFLDLTRSWNQGSSDFKLLAYRTAMLGGGIGALFVVGGHFYGASLLHALVGAEFVAAAPVLTLLLLAATFELTASSLRSAAYAIGYASHVLRLSVLSAVIYLALFASLVSQLGLVGAGWAACGAAAIPLVVMALLIRGSVRTPQESV
jgi:O-antigen/teichoic acid export membrane protein